MIASDGKIVRANTAARTFFGRSFEELVGADAERLTRPHIADPDPLRLKQVHTTGRAFEGEVRSADGDRWLRLAVHPYSEPEGGWQGVVCQIEDVTERKEYEVRLQRSLERLRELAAHLQQVREDERRRMAQEMHDELGHQLTALKLDLVWLSRRLVDADEAVRERLQEMAGLLDRTMRTVRSLTSELHPDVLDHFGLAAAIESQAEEFETHAGIRTGLELDRQDLPLPGESATALYRIFQEALTNVARHADAESVEISLRRDDGCLHLRIEDDGRGFDVDDVGQRSALGLLGMQERAHVLGGRFSIESAPNQGTKISVRIPLPGHGAGL